MEYLLPYLCMVTVPHIMVGLARFHCTNYNRTTLNYLIMTVIRIHKIIPDTYRKQY